MYLRQYDQSTSFKIILIEKLHNRRLMDCQDCRQYRMVHVLISSNECRPIVVMGEAEVWQQCISTFTATDELSQCASVSAIDEYTHHSVHVTQLCTGTTADNQLAPRQN